METSHRRSSPFTACTIKSLAKWSAVNRRFSLRSQATQSGTLAYNPSSGSVCLAHQTQPVQRGGNNSANVSVYFWLNMSNYDLSPGKQLLADRDTKLAALMLRDRSAETCFCTTAALGQPHFENESYWVLWSICHLKNVSQRVLPGLENAACTRKQWELEPRTSWTLFV